MRRIRGDSKAKGGKRARRAAIVFAFMALFAAGAVASGALGMTSVGGGSTDSTSTSAESTPSDDGGSTSTETTTTDATTASTTTEAATTAVAPIAPEISSDQPDYNPGATVLLTSHGWHPGEAVHVSVNDDVGQTWAHDVDVTADAAGDFTDQFSLPDWFVADYNVRAIGASGAVAATTFSDSAVQNVTVAVSPTTAAANAVYTVKFTPTNSVPVSDFIQIGFPSGTTLPAAIAAGNITVNGAAAPAASFSINTSQRQLQFDSPVALAANVQATVVIGATAAAIGNPPAGTYTLQLKTKDDNNQATSANYGIVATKSTSTGLTSSSNPSTYPASVTLTATITATPTPNPNGAGTVTFKDGSATLCNAVALSGNTATCTPSPALGAGAHSLTADYSGTAGFAASSGALTQTVSKGSQTITVTTHAPASAAYNSSFSVAAAASSGLAVSFSSVGGCTNSGATFTMTSGATSCTARYDQGGDANYNPATQVSETVNASKANQAITVTTHAPSSAAYNANFTVAATGGGSGNPVTFSSAGGCTNSGAAFTMTSGATACSVKYDQAGDANYNAASQVTETVSATKAGQAIAFTSTAPSNAVFGDVYQPTATGGASGNPVIFGASGACSYNGGTGTVSMISAGTCTVTADQLGNANYNAAPQASQVFSVDKASQTIAFATLADRTFGDADFAVGATASSGLAVSFAASGDCSLSGSSVHLTGAGGCTIVASQGGNSSYSAAPDVARSFSIGKGNQSIAFAALAGKTFGDADFAVGATASSALAVSFAASGDCSLSGSSVHLTGAGSCTITASQGGNSDYNAASDVPRSFSIAKASQSIDFAALADKTFGDADFSVAATASSGLPVSFAASGKCTLSGSSVHLTGAGSCTIVASQDGNSNYDAAPDVPRTFSIAKASQSIDFAALADKTYGDAEFTVSASSSSGLAVEFSALGSCTVSIGGLVHITGAGSCTVTASQAGDSNYDAATAVPQAFTVAKRSVEVTAAANSKTYGDADPPLTYELTSGALVFGDTLSGSLARDAGENAGEHNITQGTLSLSNNYDLTFIGAKLTITARPATVSAADASKVYGDGDPVFGFQVSGLVGSDSLSGVSCGVAGAHLNAGSYDIACSGNTNGNYDVDYVKGTLTVEQKSITVTAEARSKTYGEADPTLTYSITAGSLVNGDGFSGALGRDPGESVAGGPYALKLGSLSAGTNYALHFVGASLRIDKKPVHGTFTADDKIYDGNAAAAILTRSLAPGGKVGSDDVGLAGGSASFDNKNVGQTKPVTGSGFTLDGADKGNYELASVAGTAASISARPITVTADQKTKVYGNADPSLTYQVTSGSLVAGESFTGSLTRDAGESVAGGPYAIKLGSLSAGDNYRLTFVGASLAITKRPITVTADAKTKVYGNVDPALTHTVSSGSLATGDGFSGALARDAGESVAGSPYAIRQGTLSLNNNYDLSYVGASLAITRRPITVAADAKSKLMGASDPALSYQITAGTLVNADGFNGSLVRDGGESVGTYSIRQGSLALGGNYNVTFAGAALTIVYAPASAMCVGSPGHAILQPINAEGTSVWKQGSTVPAKFRVCDANGSSVGPTTAVPNVVDWFKLMATLNGVAAPIDESIDSTTPDTAFRWSASDQLWIFNISTKGLTANKTYSYRIRLKDGTDIDFKFGLR